MKRKLHTPNNLVADVNRNGSIYNVKVTNYGMFRNITVTWNNSFASKQVYTRSSSNYQGSRRAHKHNNDHEEDEQYSTDLHQSMAKSGTRRVRVLFDGRVEHLYGTVSNAPATVLGLKIRKEPSPVYFAEFCPVLYYPGCLNHEHCTLYARSGLFTHNNLSWV